MACYYYKTHQVSIGLLLLLNLVLFSMVSSQPCPYNILNRLAIEQACDPVFEGTCDDRIDVPRCCNVVQDLDYVVAASCLCTRGADILGRTTTATNYLDNLILTLLRFNCFPDRQVSFIDFICPR